MSTITYVLKHMVLIMSVFFCSQAVSQNIGYYAFLPDNEGKIDREGFDIGYHSIYSQWDLNGDGDISEPEFYTVLYQRLDSNKNGSLSVKEWDTGERYLFREFLKNGGFSKFDSNNDNNITSGEFDAGIRNTDFFRSYDSNQNGKISRNELNDAVFINMDLNNNGLIEEREFSTLRKLYMKP